MSMLNQCICKAGFSEQNAVIHVIVLPAEPMKRVQLASIPVSKSWQFGKEDIDELLFMLQVKIYIWHIYFDTISKVAI
jgi:hypothetical protein